MSEIYFEERVRDIYPSIQINWIDILNESYMSGYVLSGYLSILRMFEQTPERDYKASISRKETPFFDFYIPSQHSEKGVSCLYLENIEKGHVFLQPFLANYAGMLLHSHLEKEMPKNRGRMTDELSSYSERYPKTVGTLLKYGTFR
jgi:hypothetical protein